MIWRDVFFSPWNIKMIEQEKEFIEEADIYHKWAVHCLTYTITMKTYQVNTLEVDEIKPIIPGMGLMCTPRSLSWRKIWFYIPYKTHSGSDIHGSISFMIDNMHYVILRIWEQDSVPWCGEIQNKKLEVLGNTFNLHSNSTFRPKSVVSQSVSKGE